MTQMPKHGRNIGTIYANAIEKRTIEEARKQASKDKRI